MKFWFSYWRTSGSAQIPGVDKVKELFSPCLSNTLLEVHCEEKQFTCIKRKLGFVCSVFVFVALYNLTGECV